MSKDTDNVYTNPKENPEYKQRFEYENLDSLNKISLFCNVKKNNVIQALSADSPYQSK